MTGSVVRLVPFDRDLLDRSWTWLSDPEIRALTMTPPFSRADQERFFADLPERSDYRVWGLELEGEGPIGAAGFKGIAPPTAEYWGYIGERRWWGRGLGRLILQLIEAEAARLGCKGLTLRVAHDNMRAIGLYRREGWSEAGGGPDTLVMTKAVTE